MGGPRKMVQRKSGFKWVAHVTKPLRWSINDYWHALIKTIKLLIVLLSLCLDLTKLLLSSVPHNQARTSTEESYIGK